MGTLVFVCPTTGHEVSTGVEVDRSNYKRLSRTKTAVFCPRCRKNHMLAAIWAWLVDEGPRKSGGQHFYEVRCVDRVPLFLNDPIQFTSLFIRQAPRSCEELRLRELGPRIVLTG